MKEVVKLNGVSDGHYVEPFAGGAAIAWELLLTGVVRRVTINDVSLPIFAFWNSAVHKTDALCQRITDTPVNLETWARCRDIFRDAENHEAIDVAFSFFFLNRTNRSGILNAGVIGGKNQTGEWKIDARFNKIELINRIQKIAAYQSKITICREDAVAFLANRKSTFDVNTLIYVDPPYYEKGRHLYYDFYQPEDHSDIAKSVQDLHGVCWLVSYDDVRPIHDLYEPSNWAQYTINYSARNKLRGREAMFFSDGLILPEMRAPMVELCRGAGLVDNQGISVKDRDIPKIGASALVKSA